MELRFDRPRAWIEERVVAGQDKEIVWVRAHDGIPGNERRGGIGRLVNQRQTATTAGITAKFKCNRLSEQVKTWDRNAINGLAYIAPDRGPQRSWMYKIGKAEDDKCKCGREVQNAAHLMKCEEIGDGKGMTIEEGGKIRGCVRRYVNFYRRHETRRGG